MLFIIHFISVGNMKTVFTLAVFALVESLSTERTHQRHLALCITTIARRHFDLDRTLLVSSSGSGDGLLDIVMENLQNIELWPLRVSRTDSVTLAPYEKHHDKIGSYVILTGGPEDIEKQVDKITDSVLWGDEARFLVVVTKCEAIPHLLALNLLRELWDNTKALNVLVAVNENSVLHLYASFPYQSDKSCEIITDAVLLSKWDTQSDTKLGNNGTLFPDKYPRHFHGCRIDISIPNSKIAEKTYISETAKRLNITVNYISGRPNDMSLYDRIRSSIREVLLGSSEITVGGIPLIKDIADILDPSFSYHETKYTWYVPCARPLPRLYSISRIFSASVWAVVFVVIFAVSVVIWCLANRSLETSTYTSISNDLYNVWAIAMGVCVTEMPRTCRLRLIIFSWMCHCFAINAVFQTFLTSYLVDPGYDKQIRTLEELIDSGLKFGFRPEFDVYYQNSNYEIHKELMSRKEHCDPPSFCVQRIIDTRGYATLAESYSIENYLNTVNNSNYVCTMNDLEAYPVKIVAYFSKGSIFLRAFHKALVSSVEAGLATKAVKKKVSSTVSNAVDNFFVFTVSHLSIAFYLLLLGHSVSIVSFFFEVIYKKRAES